MVVAHCYKCWDPVIFAMLAKAKGQCSRVATTTQQVSLQTSPNYIFLEEWCHSLSILSWNKAQSSQSFLNAGFLMQGLDPHMFHNLSHSVHHFLFSAKISFVF